ncbi:hypothetical protein CTAYLR_004966 [Chrysophaeum taylorii]|uniref:SAM domain-containing protein n=1 Tax=Chrysophaeum taylorii TaxID=2483200 RepID=A0AAD7XNV9_9STRA|nr:hypothetical protein CTAYLR_004966 [Chrysophaeum taylorii]
MRRQQQRLEALRASLERQPRRQARRSSGGRAADWTVAEVGAWLETLGLSQYSQTFAKNGISGCEVLDLGLDDLDNLGIKTPAHRKRLLKGIARLGPGLPPAENFRTVPRPPSPPEDILWHNPAHNTTFIDEEHEAFRRAVEEWRGRTTTTTTTTTQRSTVTVKAKTAREVADDLGARLDAIYEADRRRKKKKNNKNNNNNTPPPQQERPRISLVESRLGCPPPGTREEEYTVVES